MFGRGLVLSKVAVEASGLEVFGVVEFVVEIVVLSGGMLGLWVVWVGREIGGLG